MVIKRDRTAILAIEGYPDLTRQLRGKLSGNGFRVRTTTNDNTLLRALRREEPHVVVSSLEAESVDALRVLRWCRQFNYDTEVVTVTADSRVDKVVETMRQGAFHLLQIPIEVERLVKVVGEAAERAESRMEMRDRAPHTARGPATEGLITQDPQMMKILEMARDVAPTDCNIIITGESGTGKEVVARFIHAHSRRADGPFLAINCGAFTDTLLANELFGHEKGAFTGATIQKKGLIEMADTGTLFLDEITEMSPSMQVKLLRVIQEREYHRIGGTEPVRVDVRFIAATNRDLHDAMEAGRFRHDLFYRLNVVSFHLPPLADRRKDIPLLCRHFLRKYASSMHKDVHDISEEAMQLLCSYHFPGNVRELENIIERGVALTRGRSMETVHLPEMLRAMNLTVFRNRKGGLPTLREHERAYIQMVLDEVGGNRTEAARILDIDRVSLWRKLKRYGMETSD